MIKLRRARKAIKGQHRADLSDDADAAFIDEKVTQARRLADHYKASETKLEGDMHAIMQCAMELHDKFVSNHELDDPLRQALNREKIRITKNTTSNYIPLMKLVAPKLPSSTIGRSAAILKFADENGVEADGISDFVQTQGGIVECHKAAKKSFNEANKSSRDQRRAEKEDAKLDELREAAKAFSLSVLHDDLIDGVWCCLIEKNGDHLSLLSVASGRVGKEFKPFAAEDENNKFD